MDSFQNNMMQEHTACGSHVHNHHIHRPLPCHQPFQESDFPIGMAYVPRQIFRGICENLEEGYRQGTIFPELNKPFTGRRCVR